MLFTTNIIAIVGSGDQPSLSPCRLQIINTRKNSVVRKLTFPTSILSIKMNTKRLVVVLQTTLLIYDISNAELMQKIETRKNEAAICGLSYGMDVSYLACPVVQEAWREAWTVEGEGKIDGGESDNMILNADTLQPLTVISAHRYPLSGLTCSYNGHLLATAGEKGTLIRVFGISGGSKLYQFRTGA